MNPSSKAQRAREAAQRYRARHPERVKACYNKWRRKNRTYDLQRLKVSHLRVYGLTIEDYRDILKTQNGVCAICKQPLPPFMSRFHVDHDHDCCPAKKSCGKCIRGLLCANCNYVLGNAQDNTTILRNAIEYL